MASRRLPHQLKTGLFKPIWMKEGLEGNKLVDALLKVRGMTSQAELCKVVVRAPHIPASVLRQMFKDGKITKSTSKVR